MNKKGFLLIEALMGLFLLGIIVVTCLPILNTGINNIKLNKKKVDMLLLAESTIEQIKAFDNSWDHDEYLFDMALVDLIELFLDENSITILLPLNKEESTSQYSCTIHKENYDKNLWKIYTTISSLKEEKKIKDVKILSFMPAPDKKRPKK